VERGEIREIYRKPTGYKAQAQNMLLIAPVYVKIRLISLFFSFPALILLPKSFVLRQMDQTFL
jgi:hypothetical protein